MSAFFDTLQSIDPKRLIGYLEGPAEGPLFIILAGIHGNEPAGVRAAQNFMQEAKKLSRKACGSIVALKGNLQALAAEKRFINKDLNRMFKPDIIEKAEHTTPEQADYICEYKELTALTENIAALAELTNQLYFVDCHTVSSESMPFISLTEEVSCEELAQKIPVFSVVGEHREPRGYTDEYFVSLGGAGFTYESGQHNDKSSIENQEAVLWLLAAHTGCLPFDAFNFEHYHAMLSKYTISGRQTFYIKYHYQLQDEEVFTMRPGFVNFQEVFKNEKLADSSVNSSILSPLDARLYMPLYQKTGKDGFFLVSSQN